LDSADDIPEYVRKNKERFSYMLRRWDKLGGGLLDFDPNLTQWDNDIFIEQKKMDDQFKTTGKHFREIK